MDDIKSILELQPGSVVELHGLKAKPELNGAKAMILPSLPENKDRGRIRLRLLRGDEQELAIKPENLRVCQETPTDLDDTYMESDDDAFFEEDEESDEDMSVEHEEIGNQFGHQPVDSWCRGMFEKKPTAGTANAAQSATDPSLYPSTSTNETLWCYGCFKELPKTCLQRCSKCSNAVFCSRECQRAANPYHKVSCGKPQHEQIESLRGSQVVGILRREFGGGGPSPNTALLLARIRNLLIQRYGKGPGKKKLGMDPDDVGMELHTMARMFIPDEDSCSKCYKMFWAAPGMPEFLLRTPLVTGVKQAPEEYTGKDKHGVTLEDRASFSVDDDIFSTPTLAGYQYAFFHFNFLLRTITQEASSGMSMCSVNSGRSALRKDIPCFQAAARRLGFLYVTSCECCGDSLAAGPGAMLMLCSGEPAMRKDFLAIGLGRAALHEALNAASKHTAKQLLQSIPMSDWQALPAEQAALLAADLASCLLERHFDEDEELSNIAREVLNSVFRRQTLQGMVPTLSASEIMQAILKLGRRSELTVRAFWHFVSQSWLQENVHDSLHKGVFDATAALTAWKVLDENRFRFSFKEEIDIDEKTARRKAYLHHLSAAMIDKSEREEWNFMFKDDASD